MSSPHSASSSSTTRDFNHLVRWPAEWEQQDATWISWPHNRGTWPGYFDPVPGSFVRFIEAISRFQRVEVLAGPSGISPTALDFLTDMVNVRVHSIRTNDVWIRDYGPTFVQRVDTGSIAAVDWRFNAWGGKYPAFQDDAAAAEQICRLVGCERFPSTLTCEGGGLESDGAGTLIATSSCFVTDTRNPGWTRQQIEAELSKQLGLRKIIWVDGGGIEGDDTDGHIDQLARFVNAKTIVAAVSSRADDPNAAGLRENVRTLREATNGNGERVEVIELPTPAPRYVNDHRVPESYCNFLFVNGAVILPTFRSPETDQHAIRLFEGLLPDRQIVPLDAYDLIWGLGAFHCASQQQPARWTM